MIYLKEANLEDALREYEFMSTLPNGENGFENSYFGISKEEFLNTSIHKIINDSKGIDLKEGYVPQTYYFLWDDDQIVGVFKIRHYLTDALIKGAGHMGYAIGLNFRGKGYASKGIKLAIEKAKDLIREDEIYTSVHLDNIASLKAQEKNGAYIESQDEEGYHTRIKIR